MGNRGCIHRRPGEIARRWQVRRWITCVLEYKGWVAPKWEPRRWTPLFFWDEAVALAAGHRPCALCRHGDYLAWLDAWEVAFGERPKADPMDRRLHADRLDRAAQRRHRAAWAALPDGVFVAVALDQAVELAPEDGPMDPSSGASSLGQAPLVAAVTVGDRLVPWSAAGYSSSLARPVNGDATVLTPRATVEVIRHGYAPQLHPTVTDQA